jgi:hypothetical protein
MRELTFERTTPVNSEKLGEDLAAALGEKFMGLGVNTLGVMIKVLVRLDDTTKTSEEDLVREIVGAHKGDEKSTRQTMVENIKTVAQSAVGLPLTDLSAPQVKALLACLLYHAGGVKDDGTVRPLGEWIKN